jgi:two-component system sensor histidine kinase CreC
MSLTTRLLLGFALVAALGFWLMFDQTLRHVDREYREAEEEPMADMANVLAEMLAQQVKNGAIQTDALQQTFSAAKARRLKAQIYSYMKTCVDMDVSVMDANGWVLYDSRRPQDTGRRRVKRDVMLTLAGEYGARTTNEDTPDGLAAVMYVAAPVVVNGKTVGVVSVAKPQRSTLAFREETHNWLRWTFGSVALCTVLGSVLIARWTIQPIRRLTDYANAISRGERPAVPQLHGPEMKTLGHAFEQMRDVLEDRDYVESYVQTLTHELKSPVAAIRGASELLQDPQMEPGQRTKFTGNIHADALRLQDLLDRLLALASLEKRKALDDAQEIDLSALARKVGDHFAPLLAQRGLTPAFSIAEFIRIRGDAFLIETALANLVQNAVDFSPPQGVISVILKMENECARFTVEDEGPGLPEYAQQRVFERFYSLPRPSDGKKSSGLGLCFVKEAALLHQGGVELANREGGKGARATLLLPAMK